MITAAIPHLLVMLVMAGSEDDRKIFRELVQPVLVAKCLNCHEGSDAKGKLDLSRRSLALKGGENGAAVIPGKPEESLLIERIEAGDMPPDQPLSQEQMAAFRAWVASGSAYEAEPLTPTRRKAGADWWSLQPLSDPSIPTIDDPEHWIRTPIDRFILAELKKRNLEHAPEGDRLTLIRRASFDLTGLPPTPEQIDRFRKDERVDAYERLIDQLLESPHYGERWARHWLDAVRFAESHGYETNSLRPNAWPYRDYVIRAFNTDRPYPEFVFDQIAGDTRPDADTLTQAATGFLVGGTHDIVGNQSIEGQLQQRVDDLDDMITAVGSAFLGLTVNCARCHDHKFDPISQRDYYALQAVLAGVQHADREIQAPASDAPRKRAEALAVQIAAIEKDLDKLEPITHAQSDRNSRARVNSRRNVERFTPISASAIRMTILATNDGSEPCLDEIEVWSATAVPVNVALTLGANGPRASSEAFPGSPIHQIVHLNDGRVGNSRSWISATKGRGWASVRWAKPIAIDRVVWGRDREGRYADRLAVHYFIEAEVAPNQWTVVASSMDRPAFDTPESAETSNDATTKQRAVLNEKRTKLLDELTALSMKPRVYAGTFTQPAATHRLERGDPMRKAEVVSPGALASVRPALQLQPNAPEAGRRQALARWIGNPSNPLPARVMMNRVWYLHFGRGLVATPGDFGFQGGAPTNQALLDWLAQAYRINGFRLKPIHRLIMNSAAYRQSSRLDRKAQSVDKDNTLLWRKSPTRLDAESLRDAILSVSGALDRRMGGPGYSLWEKNTNYVVVFTPLAQLGPESYRRMIYQFKPRSQADPTFGAFDCPDGSLVAPRRNSSTTALQALNLLNSAFVNDQAQLFSARFVREGGTDVASQVERAFLLAFGRMPTSSEAKAARALIQQAGPPALARALFNANEFLYGR